MNGGCVAITAKKVELLCTGAIFVNTFGFYVN